MRLTSALRSPNRSRAIVRPDATDQVDETQLGQAATLTQLVLLGWCAARVAADRIRGPLTIEGSIALALCIVFATLLFAKGFGWAVHDAEPADRHPPSPF
jgi:hypothetical protein